MLITITCASHLTKSLKIYSCSLRSDTRQSAISASSILREPSSVNHQGAVLLSITNSSTLLLIVSVAISARSTIDLPVPAHTLYTTCLLYQRTHATKFLSVNHCFNYTYEQTESHTETRLKWHTLVSNTCSPSSNYLINWYTIVVFFSMIILVLHYAI